MTLITWITAQEPEEQAAPRQDGGVSSAASLVHGGSEPAGLAQCSAGRRIHLAFSVVPQIEESILLLVDSKNVFQAYRLSSKAINKICKFELDCGNTTMDPLPADSGALFDSAQITLSCVYGKLVCAFVNERKGQLHLLGLANEAMEQFHVYDLRTPGKYDISVVDNVIMAHHLRQRITVLIDIRSDTKYALAPPLPIGESQPLVPLCLLPCSIDLFGLRSQVRTRAWPSRCSSFPPRMPAPAAVPARPKIVRMRAKLARARPPQHLQLLLLLAGPVRGRDRCQALALPVPVPLRAAWFVRHRC